MAVIIRCFKEAKMVSTFPTIGAGVEPDRKWLYPFDYNHYNFNPLPPSANGYPIGISNPSGTYSITLPVYTDGLDVHGPIPEEVCIFHGIKSSLEAILVYATGRSSGVIPSYKGSITTEVLRRGGLGISILPTVSNPNFNVLDYMTVELQAVRYYHASDGGGINSIKTDYIFNLAHAIQLLFRRFLFTRSGKHVYYKRSLGKFMDFLRSDDGIVRWLELQRDVINASLAEPLGRWIDEVIVETARYLRQVDVYEPCLGRPGRILVEASETDNEVVFRYTPTAVDSNALVGFESKSRYDNYVSRFRGTDLANAAIKVSNFYPVLRNTWFNPRVLDSSNRTEALYEQFMFENL